MPRPVHFEIHAVVAKFSELGGTVAMPKHAIPNVGWTFYGKDPEANIFGLHQPDPSAAQ